MYALLLAIIYVAFVSLGLPDSLVGAGWPTMHGDVGVPESYAGFLTVLIAGGTIVSSLASERLTRRLGAGLVTATSVALTAAALFGFSTSHQFWQLCLWCIPYGIGAGAVDAALNNYVALHYAARHMNWLHSFWGLGASISPFIMSHALRVGWGWSGAYRTVAIIQVVLAVALFAALPLWGRVDHATTPHDDAADEQPHRHVPLGDALRIPGVPLLLAAFFAYCGLETTTILWAASHLVSDRGVAAATAAALASLFILGVTAGRFLAGFFADRIGDRALIRGGFLTVAAGALLLGLTFLPQPVSLAGLVIAGLGAAPVYPAIIHSTPANFGARSSQAVIGIEMAAAYVGATLMPPLFGALSTVAGLGLLPWFVLALAAVGFLASQRLNAVVDARR